MKLAVVIGRFQGLHNGHVHLLKRAVEQADHVLVLVGSANLRTSPKNPFTFEERKVVIEEVMEGYNLTVKPLSDFYYDEQWSQAVQLAVRETAKELMPKTGYLVEDKDVILVGHMKDSSSYYLESFPEWQLVNIDPLSKFSATDFRGELFKSPFLRAYAMKDKLITLLEPFVKDAEERIEDLLKDSRTFDKKTEFWAGLWEGPDWGFIKMNMPEETFKFIKSWYGSENFFSLADEYRQLEEEKLSWSVSPYEPTFITTDAVVTHGSSVLLIRRGRQPGRGTLALPGGFLGTSEWIRDSLIRELREETQIAVTNSDLLKVMGDLTVFDKPDRSLRGRTVTHAARFNLDHLGISRPEVTAADDASEALWVPYADLPSLTLYDDHSEIINRLVFGRK